MVISAVTITDERKQSMDFSDPYFEARQLIAIGKGVTDVKEIRRPEGQESGCADRHHWRRSGAKLLGKTSADIKRFESHPLALKELESGGVQAVVADNGVVINYLKNNASNGIATVADNDSFDTGFMASP